MLKAFKYTRGLIAFAVVLLGFGFFFLIATVPMPAANKDAVIQAQGGVLTLLGLVLAYYFGASKDKSDHDQSKIFPKDPPTP